MDATPRIWGECVWPIQPHRSRQMVIKYSTSVNELTTGNGSTVIEWKVKKFDTDFHFSMSMTCYHSDDLVFSLAHFNSSDT